MDQGDHRATILTGVQTSVNTTYTITITDAGGCTNTSNVNIVVEDCCTPPAVDAICTPPVSYNVNVVSTGIKTFQSLTGISPSNITNKIKITGSGTVVVNGQDLALMSSNAVLHIEGPTLVVLGNFKLESPGARFIMAGGALRTSHNIQQTANTGICISTASVEVGEEEAGSDFYSQANFTSADFQNDGGYRYLNNVCLNVTQNFQLQSSGTGTGTNGVDLILNSCIEIGDKGANHATGTSINSKDGDDSGQWQSSNTQSIYGSTIVLANGNFQHSIRTMTLCDVKVKINDSGSFTNAGTMEGFELCVAVDDVFENTGTWSLPGVSWFSKSLNLTNVPGVGAEENEATILTQCFSSCNCAINSCDDFVGGISGDDVICIGESTGLIASGGTRYLWETGSTTTNIVITPVSSSWHGVYIENDDRCFKYDSIFIIVNPLPTAYAGDNQEICEGSSAMLSAIGIGGSTPYSYIWENGSTLDTRTESPISNTTYSVTVTDGNGCSNTDNVNVVVNSLPSADAGTDNEICLSSNTTISASGSGGSGPYSYLWSNGSMLPSISVSPGSTQSYLLTVTDSKGCTNSDEITITVNSLPDANAGPDQQICRGESVILNAVASGGSGGYNYNWSNGQNLASISVHPLIGTTYTLTVTDSKGCTKTDQITVIVNNLPDADAGQDTMLCAGNSAVLIASGSAGSMPYNYAWNNGVLTATNDVMPMVTTKYFVTVTDTNGCSNQDSVSVVVNPIPNAGPDPAPQNCYSIAQIIMSATGTGTWSIGAESAGTADIGSPTNPNTDVYNFSGLGYYDLVWTSSGGCRDTAVIFVNDACTCPISDNLIDAPTTVIYCGSSGTLLLTGYAAYPASGTYQWEYSFNNGIFTNAPGTSNTKDYTTQNLGLGTHKFRRRFTTTTGVICSTLSNTIAIVVREVPSVTNPSLITNSGVISGITSGTATFAFTNSVSGCVSSPTSSITVNDKPTINLTGSAAICVGSLSSLTPSSGGTWTSSNPSIASINSGGIVTGLSQGQATFTYTSISTGCVSLVTLSL